MLRAIPDPAHSMTAFNSGGDPAGLKTALRWLIVGLPLALFYFVVVFRLHRGRAGAAPEGEGY
jgi:cytochrome bd-type quinol oxidase subunit 2